MSKSKIEWTDAVWNPVTGCTKISVGCQNCYAERMSKRLAGRCGYPKDEPFKVTLHPEKINEPWKWKKPRRIFVNSMSDLFHDDVPFEFIKLVWATMVTSRQHIYMILTKRPKRMLEFFEWMEEQEFKVETTWPCVWLGVSVENQATADERIPLLLQTPAVVKFISAEPLLGPVSLAGFDGQTYRPWLDSVAWEVDIDWIIVGGESGPGARPMHPDWVRILRDQCQASGTKFFFKQWGEWNQVGECGNESDDGKYYRDNNVQRINHNGGMGYHGAGAIYMKRVGKKQAGRELEGRTWDELPETGGQNDQMR